MTAQVLPQGKQSFETAAGLPAVGWKLYTYDTGTNNPRTTWLDAAQVTPNANPIVLDARGEAVVFWSGAYRVRLEDNLGNTIWAVDGISFVDLTGTLIADLATFNNAAKGAGMIGFGPSLSYPANTVGSFFNQLYGRTASELAAGVTPVSYWYPPGNVFRYCTAAQISNVIAGNSQDVSGPIQNAMDSTTGDVYFPNGIYYIGKPLYIKTTSVFNLRLVGESRVNTEILPNAVNIQDANLINALIINQKLNGKFSMYRLRLTSDLGWTGVCISAVELGAASQRLIFSGTIDECWIDPGSSNGGFFTGGLINYVVSNTTFEFMKGCFNFTSIYSDVFFSNISLSSCYDHFITSAAVGNVVNVEGLHAYTHQRGFLFPISNCADLKISGVSLQMGVPNLGTGGLFDLVNCVGVEIDEFSAINNAVSTGTATVGTTPAVLSDSGLALTVNAYIGFTLYNVTRNLSATITANTANTITTAGIAAQASGDTYQIIWPNTGYVLGVGQIAVAISIQGVQGNFSNGIISGADTGILTHGTGLMDVNFNQVQVRRSNATAAFRNTNAGGNASGVIRLNDCDLVDAIGNLILFTNLTTYDFYTNGCRLLNAGIGGNGASRIDTSGTSGLRLLIDCVIGRDNTGAAAASWFDMAGGGQALLVDCKYLGTPPTSVQAGAAIQQASAGRLTAAFNAGAPSFSVALSNKFEITCTGNVVVGSPNLLVDGTEFDVFIKNTSGGAITVGWNAVFKVPAGLTTPATGFGRAYRFYFDGTSCRFLYQSNADVPN